MQNYKPIERIDDRTWIVRHKESNQRYLMSKTCISALSEDIKSRIQAIMFMQQKKLFSCFDTFFDNLDPNDRPCFVVVEPLENAMSLKCALIQNKASDRHERRKEKLIRKTISSVAKILLVLHSIRQPYGELCPGSIVISGEGKVSQRRKEISGEVDLAHLIDNITADQAEALQHRF